MQSKFLSAVLCLVMGIAIFFPAVKQLSHAFEHTEELCDNPTSLHIHQTEVDCEFQKFYPSLQFLPSLLVDHILQNIEFPKIRTSIYIRLTNFSQLYFSLRAPPLTS